MAHNTWLVSAFIKSRAFHQLSNGMCLNERRNLQKKSWNFFFPPLPNSRWEAPATTSGADNCRHIGTRLIDWSHQHPLLVGQSKSIVACPKLLRWAFFWCVERCVDCAAPALPPPANAARTGSSSLSRVPSSVDSTSVATGLGVFLSLLWRVKVEVSKRQHGRIMFVIFPLEDILCASSSVASKSSPHVGAASAADLIDGPISVTLQAKRADGRLHLTFSSTQPAAVGPLSPSATSTGPINCAALWSDAMSSESSSSCFKDLVHPSHSEALKTHNGLTIKLLKTGRPLFSFGLPNRTPLRPYFHSTLPSTGSSHFIVKYTNR